MNKKPVKYISAFALMSLVIIAIFGAAEMQPKSQGISTQATSVSH